MPLLVRHHTIATCHLGMSESKIQQQLDRARVELLDLTARNRLINTPRSSSRTTRLEVLDERSDEVFRRLCIQRKGMYFLPKRDQKQNSASDDDHTHDAASATETGLELAQPDDDREPAPEHIDRFLQTDLSSAKLQSRLLGLFYDARTYEQEHGVNVLSLAAGMLKWYEEPASKRPRYAPLILIPVTLDRKNANARFRLRATEEEIATNLSLQEKMRLEFDIELPDIPESFRDERSSLPSQYFDQVREAIAGQPRWEVLTDDIVLWLYSFAKFLMYQDLNPQSWPREGRINTHPLVHSLLGNGFDANQMIFGDHDSVDQIVSPKEMFHVLDADSSQMLVIEESKCGTNLVVQGPPGTGKSQTIANMIATAVASGKRVLFVAEKMAALEVVKRRMDKVGLGEMCLELHSHKANKRDVLRDLHRSLHLAKPKHVDSSHQSQALSVCREKLNRHANAIHSPIGNTEQTPYDAIGNLVRLKRKGASAPDFLLAHASHWTPSEIGDRRRLVEDLATQLSQIGNPSLHPWRGCGLTNVLPADIKRYLPMAARVSESLANLDTLAHELHELIPCVEECTIQGAEQLAVFATKMCDAPICDRSSLMSDAWALDNRVELKQLVLQSGPTAARCLAELDEVVTDSAWKTDFTNVRRHLAAHGRSLFRIFNKDYRDASATLAGILIHRPPRSLDDRLRIVDLLMEGQKAIGELSKSKLLRSAFGKHYQEHSSDWTMFGQTIQWMESCESEEFPLSFFQAFSNQSNWHVLNQLARKIKHSIDELMPSLTSLINDLNLDLQVAFGTQDPRAVDRGKWLSRLRAWQDNPETLQRWIAYNLRYQRIIAADLGELALPIHNGSVNSDEVADQFDFAYFESILRESYHEYPELAEFEGKSHESTLERFVELDRERIETARSQVAQKHHAGLPTKRKSHGMSVLRHEMKKKTRHKPLRKLIESCGPVIQAIKPVFMMSPMSVAQYLPPGKVEFDLLLIDEASQVRPSDAIGAMARAKQVIVVGDDRQLPPTTFFSKASNENDHSDGDQQNLTDLESVLGLCESKNMSSRMLSWHYRSLHQSLIAVSNKEFYDRRLFVVPSPQKETDQLGLQFHFVPGGVYDRGGTSANLVEAREVADAVMEHARETPNKSLGVGAFSVAQRDAILFELERRRREHPECEAFFIAEGPEPFFVKNLENIQGDERDCVFISVGYGRDADEKLTMSFGPLNRDGGERRLNVLISRAKERCVVFSSITADDIDLAKTQARGVSALKTFLNYAEKKVLDLLAPSNSLTPASSLMPAEHADESVFENQVAETLRARGFEIDTQVGMAGFVVDLAVIDPANRERYLLGIECDGPSYHSAKSARDRDRIRQEILEQRGWIIHRIWSIDWFNGPESQLQELIDAIESAKNRRGDDATHHGAIQENRNTDTHTISREQTQQRWGIDVTRYVESDFPVNRNNSIPQTSPDDLQSIIARIVNTEGPIHRDEIHSRVRGLWGVSRRGNRITKAIESATIAAISGKQITQDGDFFWPTRMTQVPIRNRSGVWQSSLRNPDHIPPQEMELVIDRMEQIDQSLMPKEALKRLCDILGITRPTAKLVDRVEARFSKSRDDRH